LYLRYLGADGGARCEPAEPGLESDGCGEGKVTTLPPAAEGGGAMILDGPPFGGGGGGAAEVAGGGGVAAAYELPRGGANCDPIGLRGGAPGPWLGGWVG
jgi:hypothetical protein